MRPPCRGTTSGYARRASPRGHQTRRRSGAGVAMHRRDFVRLAGSGISATALAETLVEAQVARSAAPARRSPPIKMHVGTQQGDSEEMLRAFAAFGVNHV